MAISVDSCVVALLGRDDGARRQLREALEELGAAVAFEGEPGTASDTSVLGVGPNVVIVNLEEGADDDLDHLQAVFDDPAINVVFNDADVSRALEGWDLARWARHLAAKVLGSEDVMPPPPEGAKPLIVPDAFVPTPGPVPTPAQLAPEQTMDSFLDEAQGLADEVPVDALPEAIEVAIAVEETLVAVEPEADVAVDALDIDLSSLDDALEAADAPVPVRLASTPEPVESESLDTLVVEDLSDDIARALDVVTDDTPPAQAIDEHPVPTPMVEVEAETETEVEFGWDFDEPAETRAPEVTVPADDADAAVVSEFLADTAADAVTVESDFSWDVPATDSSESNAIALDTTAWSLDETVDAQTDEAALLDDDVAALAAQLDAFEASESAVAADTGLDFSGWNDAPAFDPQPPMDVQAPVAETASEPDAQASSFGGLSLAPMDDYPAATAPASPAAKASFDFSSLGELSLEPLESDEAADAVSDGIVTLDLVEREVVGPDAPVPDAVIPDADPAEATLDPTMDPLLIAMGLVEAPVAEASELSLVSDTGGIEHVVVLGASIGGPDALRTFLSELPVGIPAAFLIVQHLESGYFERLAQQLQKSSPLPVKVAASGTVAMSGEVLVIPASERVTLETDGRLSFCAHTAAPHYTPCIDDVLRDVADRFGSRATAIIFSGMAGDAVEGAVYLTAKGGEVWAQDPSSCVVSSMVDGARARGAVEFTGSPRELAQRCAARFLR